jgi:hypothetical protein
MAIGVSIATASSMPILLDTHVLELQTFIVVLS